MRASGTPAPRRTISIVLGLLAVAVLLSALTAVVLFQALVAPAVRSPGWSDDAVDEASVGRLFGVRFPARPVALRSRDVGFTEPAFDLLAKLPAGGTQDFLAVNHLAPGARPDHPGCDVEAASAEVRSLGGGAAPVRVTSLDGPADLVSADGGMTAWSRASALLDVDGTTWVLLCAEAW